MRLILWGFMGAVVASLGVIAIYLFSIGTIPDFTEPGFFVVNKTGKAEDLEAYLLGLCEADLNGDRIVGADRVGNQSFRCYSKEEWAWALERSGLPDDEISARIQRIFADFPELTDGSISRSSDNLKSTRTPRPTRTPKPTRTPWSAEPPETTRTPSPPAPIDFEGVVTEGKLNARTGPGTDFVIILQLPTGERVKILGRNQAGDWLKIDLGESTAWVYQQYIETETEIDQLPVVDP